MSNAITLPPLPRLPDGWWKDKVTEEQMEAYIRARDLEVARLVLEAAADQCRAIELAAWKEYKIGRRTSPHAEGRSDGAGECAVVVRSLEVKHHE